MIKLALIIGFYNFLIVEGFKFEEKPKAKNDDSTVVYLKYSTSSNFMEVDLKGKVPETLQKESGDLTLNINIVNDKSISVFSGSKKSIPFSVYIGGLPNGKYTIFVNTEDVTVSKNFELRRNN